MTLQLACQAFADPDDIYGGHCACNLDADDDAGARRSSSKPHPTSSSNLSQAASHGICMQTVRPFKVDGFDSFRTATSGTR